MPKVNINDVEEFEELDELEETFESFNEIKKTKMKDETNRYKNKKQNKGRERDKK